MSDREVALAKVGLRALIDEATGFQEQRADDDLRKYARSVGLEDYMALIEERIALGLAHNTGKTPSSESSGDQS